MSKQRCLCERNSRGKVRWDLLIMLLAVWNAFQIPINVAFPGSFFDSTYFLILNFFIDIGFLLDIIVNFRTTFLNKKTQEEVSNSYLIAVEYLKTRFTVDLLATIPFDNIGGFFIPEDQTVILQIFGLLKLVRILRLSRIITFLNVKSDLKMSLKIFKIIFFLVIYLHCVACTWYWIASLDESWLPRTYVFIRGDFYKTSDFTKYLEALYHAVLLFTGNDIQASKTLELAFCVPVLIIGALMNANIFGEVAVIVTSANRKSMKFQERIDMTRNSMKNLNLPESIQQKVINFMTFTQNLLDSQKEMQEFLFMISPSLRMEVVKHMFLTIVENNKYLFNKELIEFISRYLQVEIYMPEAQIVSEGDAGDTLYFLSKGECEVLIKDERKRDQLARYLVTGSIFGEIALIYRCKRTATVRTKNYCSTTCISRYEFFTLGQSFSDFFQKMKSNVRKLYIDKNKSFLYTLIKQVDYLKDLTDDTIEELCYSMRKEYIEVGSDIFRVNDPIDSIYFIING